MGENDYPLSLRLPIENDVSSSTNAIDSYLRKI